MKTIVNAYRTHRKRQPLFHVLPLLFLFSLSMLGAEWLTGCSDDILNPPVEIPTGDFQGQYILSSGNPSDTIGIKNVLNEVTLTINATLKTYRLVPLGDSSNIVSSQGIYKLAYRKITFTDRSMKTVPDTSLLLNGEYTYTFDGSNLVIIQTDLTTKREKSFYLVRTR